MRVRTRTHVRMYTHAHTLLQRQDLLLVLLILRRAVFPFVLPHFLRLPQPLLQSRHLLRVRLFREGLLARVRLPHAILLLRVPCGQAVLQLVDVLPVLLH